MTTSLLDLATLKALKEQAAQESGAHEETLAWLETKIQEAEKSPQPFLKKPWPTDADYQAARQCTCNQYPHQMDCGMPSLAEFTGKPEHVHTLLIPAARIKNARQNPAGWVVGIGGDWSFHSTYKAAARERNEWEAYEAKQPEPDFDHEEPQPVFF